MNTRLTNIGELYGTDKATYHRYTELYQAYFEKFMDTNPTLLEIGIYKGASLKMLNDFFYNKCYIVAFDSGAQLEFQNYFANVDIVLGDQSNRADLAQLADYKQFDIIIDDGSHHIDHQLISFATLFPRLAPNGIYIIEDLQTSHPAIASTFNPHGIIDTVTWLGKLVKKDYIQPSCLTEAEAKYLYANVGSIELLYPRGPVVDPADGSATSIIRRT